MSVGRLGNVDNKNQNIELHKRVLCVCSAGVLRSPTAAVVLAGSGVNTRAAGLDKEYALIPVDDVLLTWADEIVCMSWEQWSRLVDWCDSLNLNTPIICLEIEDDYSYMDPVLVELITTRYRASQQVLATGVGGGLE